ncbi:phosphodiesterase [Parendozoicomonas haliclonae]|uniref:Phosphoesterase n=1 Tax=Parendozoicomonas haliclonae TaxID=1960125 RepID=A0A1X7AHM3_9GAMM|nr:phosphodiesterase [Parendozoicomonas haliclonae]SMA43148.1 Phosphodiesterase YfcE [Parendozoicomonas haliclonae]
MKLMLISDIHGSPSGLEQALKLSDREQATRIIVLGDLLNPGPRNPLSPDYDPQAVAALLNTNAARITCVRGNCDSEVDQMLIDVPVMGDYALVLVDNRQLFLTHGHLWHPDKLPYLNKGDVFCFGHTHIPVLEQHQGITLFNPGSVTLPKGGSQASVGWYEDGRLWITDLQGQCLMEGDAISA